MKAKPMLAKGRVVRAMCDELAGAVHGLKAHVFSLNAGCENYINTDKLAAMVETALNKYHAMTTDEDKQG